MRHPAALLTVVALVLTSCSSNDPEDVVLTSREALIERYGSLAPGTFRIRHPSAQLEFQGTEMKPGLVNPTLSLISRPEPMFVVMYSVAVVSVDSTGSFGWSGSYNGPEGPHDCSGTLYVLESTPTLLRGVFAGSCGKVNPLRGPHDFTLVEGGFAYVR